MAVSRALRASFGALARNPVVFLVTALPSLLQLPQLGAQALGPLVGALASIAFSALFLFVMPFVQGGLIGMADEALDGRTRPSTFVNEGAGNYVYLLVAYFLLFLANGALGIVVFVAVFAGILLSATGARPTRAASASSASPRRS